MIKVLGKILLVVVIIIMNVTTCFAYSDDLFEFDLPEEYKLEIKENGYAIYDKKNKYRGIVIETRVDNSRKKTIWDMKESELNEFKNLIATQGKILTVNKKAKLGKEKAIQITIREKNTNRYWEIYILSSNKYFYAVQFMGVSQQELNNSDYKKIKESFNLKDSTMDYRVKEILALGGMTVVMIFVQHKRKKKEAYLNNIT